MGKLAEAYVEIGSRTKGFDDGIASSQAKLKDFVGSSNSLLGSIGLGIGTAGVIGFLKSAIDSGATLNETISKIGQVFGASAGTVTAMAEDMAKQFGSVKTETLDAAAAFGLIAQGAGLTEAASAKLSVSLVRLADDAASFYDKPLDVALQKLRSGLVGEAEPLREFGVLLSESAVKARALKDGASLVNGELSETDKVMTRVKLIQEGLAKAMGDHDRTMGGYKNQVKLLAGEFENLKSSMGGPMAMILGMKMQAARTGEGDLNFWAEAVGENQVAGTGPFKGKSGAEIRAMRDKAAGFKLEVTPEEAKKDIEASIARRRAENFVGPPMRPPGLQPSEVFGGGGFGALGMMGTLGLKMAQQGAIDDVDKAIGQASKSRFQGNLGSQSVDSFLASAQATVLDDSNKQQLDELKAIKETLIAIRDGQAKPGPQMKQGTFLQGRE